MKNKGSISYNYDLTIDLHGYFLDDAIIEIESHLYAQNPQSIMIIHGIGSGVLRNGIRKFLISNSFINTIYYGEELNLPGGAGITIIHT